MVDQGPEAAAEIKNARSYDGISDTTIEVLVYTAVEAVQASDLLSLVVGVMRVLAALHPAESARHPTASSPSGIGPLVPMRSVWRVLLLCQYGSAPAASLRL